jgi:hypothetical protein
MLNPYTTCKRGATRTYPVSIHVDDSPASSGQSRKPRSPTARCSLLAAAGPGKEREGLTDPWETENSAGDHLSNDFYVVRPRWLCVLSVDGFEETLLSLFFLFSEGCDGTSATSARASNFFSGNDGEREHVRKGRVT